jgi:hypothetical protein
MKVLLIKGSRDGHCVLLRALAVLSSARCTFLWISADLFGGIELKMYLAALKMLFKAVEHKFLVAEHKFKAVEYKFTVRKHKKYFK